MSENTRVDFRVLEGPSLIAPFAAVVAEFSSAFSSHSMPAADAGRILVELLPSELIGRIVLPQRDVGFASLAAAVARALQDLPGPCDLPVEVRPAADGQQRIVLGYLDPQAALQALCAGFEMAAIAFQRGAAAPERKRALAALIQRVTVMMRMRQPDFIARALMRVARRRKIPFYPVAPGSRIWLYGQGSQGKHFFEAANQRDSYTGSRLARNKLLSNEFVTRLGLPGVVHGIAGDAEAAAEIAAELGFPVVVKPVDRNKGAGITANITSSEELKVAFGRAIQASRNGVLVERHVQGDDHRLAVFGGAFAWCARRSPPRLTGDGQHTVAELIARENLNRSDADVAAGFITRLAVDADMRAVLAKQHLNLNDRPEPGRVVQLRAIANTATGGTITDCSSSIHPENRSLAETIARSFRMDAVGIDFMTPDITRSWREVPCAVLEVNATPGFSSDGRAEIILRQAFPDDADGRIPSVLLIGADRPLIDRVTTWVQATGRRVGTTDAAVTALAGHPRCKDADQLPERVMALLLDAGCDALVISASPDDVERHGFPLDRCDVALIADGTVAGKPLRKLIDDCATSTVEGVTEENFDQRVVPTLTAALGDRRAPCGGTRGTESRR